MRLPRGPGGMVPARAAPGRRRIVTRLFSQVTPVQVQTVVGLETFQATRGATAARKAVSADTSAARSAVAGMEARKVMVRRGRSEERRVGKECRL